MGGWGGEGGGMCFEGWGGWGGWMGEGYEVEKKKEKGGE